MLYSQKLSIIIFVFFSHNVFSQYLYEINGGHSNVGFAVQWREIAIRTGEFKGFGGEIRTLKDTDLNGASVLLKINSNSIDVIADHLANKLKGEEFLDTLKYPQIVFSCSGIKLVKDKNYVASGKLTIKGISKDIDFTVEDLGRADEGKYGALKVAGTINRKDFGINGGGTNLGEKIVITSYFELNRKDKKE